MSSTSRSVDHDTNTNADTKKEVAPSSKKHKSSNRRIGRKSYWSAQVTKNSDALDLEPNVFTFSDPQQIARSLKHSAERSQRRKTSPFQSATSMLNFYVNRAGHALPPERKSVLTQAKEELRKLFGRDLRHCEKIN